MKFFPLHNYSGYSFLRSGLTVEALLRLVAKNHYEGVGLSDFETLSGAPEFCHACAKAGVKALFGMDIEVEGNLVSLFVMSEEGYANLLAIDLAASQNKISLELLKAHKKGLAAVLSSEHSFLHAEFAAPGDLPMRLSKFSQSFEDLSLGVPYLPDEKPFIDFLRLFVAKYPYKTIAFPHFLYEKPKDAIVLSITKAISEEKTLDKKEENGNCYFLSPDEIASYYLPPEIEATGSFFANNGFVFIKKRGDLLHYDNDLGLTSAEYLRKLAYEGLGRRVPDYGPAYTERLDFELGVIGKMGYSDYFLVVQDYVNWARTHGVSVGPGRGSGAGSLVSFVLDIVTPDPLKYDLLFERFLNPERQTMPDIDVDFADVSRERVVDYLISKYGRDRVSRIITMQTIGARQAIRDTGRVFSYEPREIDLVAKSLADPKLSLRDSYRQNRHFKDLVDSDKYYLDMVALAAKIEGLPRQAGLHAAGVILNDKPLARSLPITDSESAGSISQYEMNYLEEQGFLKMDILGLRNLSIVDACLALIEKNEGIKLDYQTLPWENQSAITLIRGGATMGIFQLETPGMRRAIAMLKPTSFEDIVALLALFRPGPMESIPSYARRKAGLEKVTYFSPELEKILTPTYGIIVYQEQIMQIVRAMAGFSYGQADLFRRAISKKDAKKLAALKESFVKGCLATGHSERIAIQAYDLIYKFADYGFNRSHSLAYAILACQMAYLKATYPKEFYAAILDFAGASDAGKFPEIISEIKKMNIFLAVPDINESEIGFVIKNGKLVFPLSVIRGLTGNMIRDVLEERTAHGSYADFFDFALRAKRYGLNLAGLIRFIDAGCFDSFGHSRASLRASAHAAISYAEMLYGGDGGQLLLKLNIEKPAYVAAESNQMSDLNAEYESIGLMVSGSPLTSLKNKMAELNVTPLADLPSSSGEALCVGIVRTVRVITTKKGSQMAFLSIYDDTSEADLTLFGEAYNKAYPVLKEGKIVLVKCRRDGRKEEGYVADEVTGLENNEQ